MTPYSWKASDRDQSVSGSNKPEQSTLLAAMLHTITNSFEHYLSWRYVFGFSHYSDITTYLLNIAFHYSDAIMGMIASRITSFTIVYSTVYSDADQRKHQSSASLAFVLGIHRDRWIPRTMCQFRGKCFHLMTSSRLYLTGVTAARLRWYLSHINVIWII